MTCWTTTSSSQWPAPDSKEHTIYAVLPCVILDSDNGTFRSSLATSLPTHLSRSLQLSSSQVVIGSIIMHCLPLLPDYLVHCYHVTAEIGSATKCHHLLCRVPTGCLRKSLLPLPSDQAHGPITITEDKITIHTWTELDRGRHPDSSLRACRPSPAELPTSEARSDSQ